MPEKEIRKVVSKCSYDVDNKKWDVPVFTVKEKLVALPRMPNHVTTPQ
jgi:hypothetical protein